MVEPDTTADNREGSADDTHSVSQTTGWGKPFGNPDKIGMEKLAFIKSHKPFSLLRDEHFTQSLALDDILRHDGRIVRHRPGDVITHFGDYGTSCFLVLSGQCRIILSPVEKLVVEDKKPQITGIFSAVKQHFRRSGYPESRDTGHYEKDSEINIRESDGRVIHVLKDTDEIIQQKHTRVLGPGIFFGEISAITRAPRSAMIFTETDVELYELRWQGFRDLRKFGIQFRAWVDNLLSERSMAPLLAANPILGLLTSEQLAEVAAHSSYEQFGDTYWYRAFGKLSDKGDENDDETYVLKQGAYLDGVLLIRGGFARVLENYGGGERTVGYLAENQIFGLYNVIDHQRDSEIPMVSSFSLKAIGYLDLIRIPTHIFLSHVVPALVKKGWVEDRGPLNEIAPRFDLAGGLDQSLMEDLLDKRIFNGTATMLIDLNRCVGCDDCVRACAVAHDNNPRFVRHGLQHANLQYTNACMHCRDPVCTVDCPTGAIVRTAGTQVIAIDDSACIGCGSCASSCPYDNIRMVEIRDHEGRKIINVQTGQPVRKASKCDLCIDQLGGPACARACPHDALVRIDTADRGKLAQWLNR